MGKQPSQAQQTSLSVNDARPLTELRSKETAIIDGLRGGAGFRRRLAALGFTPGTKIKMLQNRGHGAILVTVRDTRIALGRGEAHKIWVKSE
jgi:ferrous iron transport protein A